MLDAGPADPSAIVVADPFPWQNPSNFVDVSGKDGVTPLDALLVINELLRNGIHGLPVVGEQAVPPPYYDVSPDGIISAADAIPVINQLIRQNKLDASGAPNTLLVLPGSFQADVPTSVRFIDMHNQAIVVPALSVTATSIETVVPPYWDAVHGQFRGDVVRVEVVQQGQAAQPIYSKFLIDDTSSFDAFQNGLGFHLAWDVQGLTNLNINDYERIAATIGAGETPDFVALNTLLHDEFGQLDTMWRAETSVILGPIPLFTDTGDANHTTFELASTWMKQADRQIAGWLQTVTGATGPVDVEDLRAYLSVLVIDARSGRANGDAAAVARAREKLDELLHLATGTIASAVALENEAADGHPELKNVATVQTFLAISVAGLAVTADLQIVAGEFYGSATEFHDTITQLSHNGLREVLQFGAPSLAGLVAAGTIGSQVLDYGNALGDTLSALHDSTLPNNLGTVRALFDASFNTILGSLVPTAPAVNVVRIDPTVLLSISQQPIDLPHLVLVVPPLQTSPGANIAAFYVQLATRPTAPVTFHFTTTAPDDSAVTQTIEFAPDEWMQLMTVVVTAVDDGVPGETLNFSVQITVDSTDSAYNGIAVADVAVAYVEP